MQEEKRKRDYKREYELSKGDNVKTIAIGIRVPKTVNEDFIAKCELENVTRYTKINELIAKYTYGAE